MRNAGRPMFERGEQAVAQQREQDQHQRGKRRAAQRHAPPVRFGLTVRQRGENRRKSDRIDHHEQNQKSVKQQLEHVARRSLWKVLHG